MPRGPEDSLRLRMLGIAAAALLPAVLLPAFVATRGGGFLEPAQAAGIVILVLAVFTVTWFLSQRLVQGPMEDLVRAARDARRGHAGHRAPEGGPREVAAIGRAINALVDEVAVVQSALETTLAEQAAETAALREEMQQYTSGISHDLREPLLVVQLSLRRIQRQAQAMDTLDEVLTRRVDDAQGALQSAIRMVDRLVRGDRQAQDAPEPAFNVDLEACLERALRDLEARIQRRHAEVTSDVLPDVHGNQAQLQLVLQNLIGNAIKYGGDPPKVVVRARDQEDQVRVEVEDNGPGVPEEQRQRIFQPFLQLQDNHGDGVGLGLSMCRRVVEAHGGSIGVEDAPGGGSVFWFTLPQGQEAGSA